MRNPKMEMEAEVAGFPWAWKQMLWDSRGDGTNFVWDSHGNIARSFVVHPQQQFSNCWRTFSPILLTPIVLLSINRHYSLN